MKTHTLTGIGLIVIGLASSASAAAKGYALQFSPAELSHQQGQQKLERRIARIARDYCPTYAQMRSHADRNTCIEGVVTDLQAKVRAAQTGRLAARSAPAQAPLIAQVQP